jgi:microcystin-dependent protein
MTIINVLEFDASGKPLAGFIRVNLANPISDYTTGASWLPTPSDVVLVNGVATLDLLPSTDKNTNYIFEVWQYSALPDTEPTRIYAFQAAVPPSATPIQFRTLIEQTGIVQDATDASIAAVVRELFYSATFWTTLQQYVYPNTGTWQSTQVYTYGSLVQYQGNTYSSISVAPQVGNNPVTATDKWRIFAQGGATGSGTSGDNVAYDATAWNDPVLGLKAPSKKAVRDIIETLARTTDLTSLAPKSGALLTSPRTNSSVALGDRSNLIVTSNWVQTNLDAVRLAINPIGSVQAYAGASAPTYWLLCDGRTVSQTTYASLYAVLSTLYNTGGEAAGTFRLPDLRGRVVAGLDSMSALMGAANQIPNLTTLGTRGGAATHTLSINEMPSHNHAPPGSNTQYLIYQNGVGDFNMPAAGVYIRGYSGVSNTGGGLPHNNLPPYNGLNYIIYAGV